MLKKVVGAAALVAALCLSASAQDAEQVFVDQGPHREKRVGVWGGYTTGAMSDVNDSLKATAGPGGSVTKIENGYTGAVDFMLELGSPRLFVGPRLEYIGFNQGKATNANSSVSMKQDLYLVPIMVGGRYFFRDMKSRWNLSAALFAGIGLGYGTTKIAAAPAPETSTDYSGQGFVSDLIVGGEYAFSKTISLGLDVGYRFADISSMSTSTGAGGGGGGGYAPRAAKANVVNPSGGTVSFDFSGLIANIGLNFRW